jgi:hypothetical protein
MSGVTSSSSSSLFFFFSPSALESEELLQCGKESTQDGVVEGEGEHIEMLQPGEGVGGGARAFSRKVSDYV